MWSSLRSLFVRAAGGSIVHHPDYARGFSGLPVDPLRARRILAFLLDRGLVRRRDVSVPEPASLEDVLRVHTPAYVESLESSETLTRIVGAPLVPGEEQELLAVQRLVAGGTVRAARLALESRRVTVNLGGGFHHAAAARGSGFCVFNDIAVAIARSRERGFCLPVLIVDLDLHDGDGTRAIFARDPTVHTFSVHNVTLGPSEGVASTMIALGSGVTDEVYLDTLRRVLPPILRDHRPELVFYVAGCDPAADDRLGDWRISPEGMLARDRFVVEQVRPRGYETPLVVLLGGGYGESAWRYSARFLSWLLSGRAVDPPEDMEAVLHRFRRLERERSPGQPGAARDVPDWSLGEEDLKILAPGGIREPRFLARYSRHAVELSLERLGILEEIRARGFPSPVLELKLDPVASPTLRLLSDPHQPELLMELRARRERGALPGMEVLYLEWLLLQNPQARFTPGHERLPGQRHPGLGLVRVVMAWLALLCEQLQLDGVYFEASHFHVAALASRHARFLRPGDGARFEALREAVAALSLAEASAAVEEARVRDAATGRAVDWRGAPMVYPVSPKLQELVSGPGYEAEVEAARRQLDLRLTPSA